MMHYRSNLIILRDMIRACQRAGGLRKTHIMQLCNMSPTNLEEYMTVAINSGFIAKNGSLYHAELRGITYADEIDSATLKVNYNEQK